MRRSWDAKRWVQVLLFDNSPKVRIRAAKLIAETDYLQYLPDMETAMNAEKDMQTKQAITRYVEQLKALLP